MARRLPGWASPPILGASAITAMAGAAQFGVTAALGDVAVEFGVATAAQVDDQVGLSAGTLGIALAVIRFAGVGALVGSIAADRLGRRLVLLGCAFIGLVATGVAATMPTFWGFVLVVALGRPLLTTTNAVVPVVAAEESRTADRSSALAYVAAAYAGGAGLVSVVRSVGGGIGYRPLLLGTAALVLLLPLVARYVRDAPAVVEDGSVPHAQRERIGLVDRQYVRPLALLCGLAALGNLVTGPALTWLFVYGEQVVGASSGLMAALVIGAGVSGLAGLLVGRWAADRAGRRLAAAVGTALVPGTAVFLYSGGMTALVGGYLATVFLLALIGPPVAALLNEVMPTRTRATANGWVGLTAVLGGVTGLVTFGALIDSMPSYTQSAAWLFLPTVPFSLGYLLLPSEVDDDVARIDELIGREQDATRVEASDPA